MLESFLNDFSFIRDALENETNPKLFGKNFPFFSSEPILFYNSATDVIVYSNSAFATEFNYTVEDLAALNYSIYPLFNNDDQEPFRETMKGLIDSDVDAPFSDATYRIINKGKRHSYYRMKVQKLHKVFYYIQLENASKLAIPVLNNSTADELMQNAESILKFGFWMWDIPKDKLYWTRGMYQLLEYDMDEDDSLVISPAFYSNHILNTEAHREFQQEFAAGKMSNSYTRNYQVKTKNGRWLTVSEHGKIEHDRENKPIRVMGITRDITLQEESLKSLADYQAMMLENETFLNYGTWESDADGSNIFWSAGMYKIFGYSPEDKEKLAINKDLYITHIHPDDTIRGLNTNLPRINTDDQYQWDYQIKDNNQNVKILSTYGKIIRDNANNIQRIIGTTRDVTELRGYEKTLENKIMELNRSNNELEEFAYVASHDLQEPLRKISTFSQRLQLRFAEKLGEDGNLYLSRMVAACDNMRKLIDNLLEFSRISINKQTPQQVNLDDVASEAIAELDLIILETNATINIVSLPPIEGVPSQLLQLFLNLLNNSIKFRKENVPLVVDVTCRKLSAKDKKEHQLDTSITYYQIGIQDNGIGFEQQYATKIFQVFQRLQGKTEYPGTGIGLSICKKIVANHKGLIFAQGEPELGALFSIILPQHQ